MRQIVQVVVVLGCAVFAAASASAPGKHNVTKSREIAHGFDATWAALIDIFADRSWAIDNMEKDSGLITTDWMSIGGEDSRYVDCGSSGLSVVMSTQVRFNVRVKGDENVATVTVNTKFRQERRFDNSTTVVDCVSTGIVESEIQRAVDSAAVRVAKRKPKKAPAVVEKTAAVQARGFYCATTATAGFCVRDKAECQRTRDVSIAALPDLTECTLTERAFCFGDRCAPSAEACDAMRARALGPDGTGEPCADSE